MTLILNNEEVEQVLSMDMCLEVLEEAFTDLGRDVAVNQLRMHTYVSQESSRSLIVINSRAQSEYAGHPDLLDPIAEGVFGWEKIHELGTLMIGEATGRTKDTDITVYKNNVGMGIQFAAVGARVLERAQEKGLGREIPTDWFLETIHP